MTRQQRIDSLLDGTIGTEDLRMLHDELGAVHIEQLLEAEHRLRAAVVRTSDSGVSATFVARTLQRTAAVHDADARAGGLLRFWYRYGMVAGGCVLVLGMVLAGRGLGYVAVPSVRFAMPDVSISIVLFAVSVAAGLILVESACRREA